ncbi:MAG: roadblock/LC7 domain-containing protein [Campylobacterales bacterium]
MSVDLTKITSEGNKIIEEFVKKMGLEGAMVVSADGFDLASYFSTSEIEPDLLAANVASIQLASEDLANQNKKGNVSQIVISAAEGEIAIKTLEGVGALVIVAPKDYKMGLLLIAIKQLVEKLH